MKNERLINDEWHVVTARSGAIRTAIVIVLAFLGCTVATLEGGETPSPSPTMSDGPANEVASRLRTSDSGPRTSPWEWTLEQRLEERFDPEKIAARQAAHQRDVAGTAQARENEPVQTPQRYSIRGGSTHTSCCPTSCSGP